MKDFLEEMNAQPGVEVNIMPVVGDSSLLKLDESQLPDAIPVLALRNAVVFPGTVFPVTIGREKSIRLIRDAESREGVLGAVPQLPKATSPRSALSARSSRPWRCRTAP